MSKDMGKRFLGRLMTLLLLFSLMGCSPGEERTEETDSPREDLIVVGVSQIGAESDWRNACTRSIKNALSAENGFYLIFDDAQQKQENQMKAVRNFILQEVDVIVLCPLLETGWNSVLQEAREAEIPVVIADRRVDADQSLYTCWVGADFYSEGKRAGEWLEKDLERQGRDREEIHIVTLSGTEGSSASIGRRAGFDSVLEKHPNWEMLEIAGADFTQAKGEEVMGEFLEKYEDIDVVISENDNMAFGAVDAIRAAGRTCGPEGEIMILSFDAVSAAFEAMINGEINADFECNPLLGPKLAEIIKTLDAGGTVEKTQYMEETYFDTTMDLEEILKSREY